MSRMIKQCYIQQIFKNPLRGSLVATVVKNLPAKQETWVRSLGRKDPLEKGMAIHSGILAQRISWTEEPGRLQSMGSQKLRHNLTNQHNVSFQILKLNSVDPLNSINI